MSSYTALSVEHRVTGIAELTLTRPQLHNRVDDVLHQELADALTDLARDRDVRAVVLASQGRSF
jgi:enoyl-CoA hydratase